MTEEIEEKIEAAVEPQGIKLHVKGATGDHYYYAPNGCPLGEAHDVLVQIKSYLLNQMIGNHNKETNIPLEEKSDG